MEENYLNLVSESKSFPGLVPDYFVVPDTVIVLRVTIRVRDGHQISSRIMV